MARHRGLLYLVLVLSFVGGCVAGGTLGNASAAKVTSASVVGELMLKQQQVRFVCNADGCTPYIPASAVGEHDFGGHKASLWSAVIGASAMTSLLFAVGILLRDRRASRRTAKGALPIEPTSISGSNANQHTAPVQPRPQSEEAYQLSGL